MKYLDILREQLAAKLTMRAAAVKQMEAAASHAERSGRSKLTPHQQSQFDEARSIIEKLDAEPTDDNPETIPALEARIGELEAIEARARNAANVPFSTIGGSDAWSAVRSWSAVDRTSPSEARSAALAAIDEAEGAPDLARQTLTQLIEDPNTRTGEMLPIARWAAVTSDPDYLTGFAKMLVDPTGTSVRMTDGERAAFGRVGELQRSMVIGTPSAGGYMMPFTLDPSILLTSAGNVDPMPAIATTKFITTDTWHGVSSAGVTSSWDAEAEEVSDDTPTLAQPTIGTHKLTTFVPFSIEAEMDLLGLLDELRTLISDDQQVKQGEAFWTGNGTSQPRGLITALDANVACEIATATDNVLVVGDIYKLLEAVPPRFRPRATWAGDIVTLNKVRRFGEGTTGSNSAFWADLGEDKPPMLIGRPVVEASPMDAFAGSGAQNILVAGDFSKYVIVRRIGTTMEIVPHLFGENGRPTGQRGIFAYSRTGGNSVVDNAFRLLQS